MIKKQWSDEEFESLKKDFEGTMPILEIEKKYNRTRSAIYHRIFEYSNIRRSNKNSSLPIKEESYKRNLHKWIRKNKIKSEFCELCFENKPTELANISQLYLKNVDDFIWLCRKCHRISDGRIISDWSRKELLIYKKNLTFFPMNYILGKCGLCGTECDSNLHFHIHCAFALDFIKRELYSEIKKALKEMEKNK